MRYDGDVNASLSIVRVAGGGLCSVRWSVTARGSASPMTFNPDFSFVQDYAVPSYELSVEVEDCDGLRGYSAVRLNTRDYNNAAIPYGPPTLGMSTRAQYRFDTGLDSDIGDFPLRVFGSVALSQSNLEWMLPPRSGSALAVGGGSNFVYATFDGREFDRTDLIAVRLRAMIYVVGTTPRGASYTNLLSLKKSWRAHITLSWNKWTSNGELRFGEAFAFTGADIDLKVFNLHQWHWLELEVNATHYSYCIDGTCVVDNSTEMLDFWLGPEPVRLEVGNFDGFLDEVAFDVEHGGAAVPASLSEDCSTEGTFGWVETRTDIGPFQRVDGQCQIPTWQGVVGGGGTNDDVNSLDIEVEFVAVSEGQAGFRTLDDDGSTMAFGAGVWYNGSAVIFKSNNLGWAPQTYEDATEAPTSLRARLSICGSDTVGSVWNGSDWVVVHRRFNTRLGPPPYSMVSVAAGVFSTVKVEQTRSCPREAYSYAVYADSFLETCDSEGSMSTPWVPRFKRVQGASYAAGVCEVVTYQYVTLNKLFLAHSTAIVIKVIRSGDMSFALHQAQYDDGFYPHDGFGLGVSLGSSESTVRSNNLGYEPQTYTSTGSGGQGVLVVLCAQRSLVWIFDDSASTAIPPTADALHDYENNRFVSTQGWLFRLSAGSADEIQIYRDAAADVYC
mmetsp:Transcript_52100/g.118576  ORF Transcript_52100/g.118576 Transcript_52100/m.118576 type:complete len:669 (+) Transcript_52100:1-2007(+)